MKSVILERISANQCPPHLRWALASLVALAMFPFGFGAEAPPPDLLYRLDVPSGETVTYNVPIPVESNGTLIIKATWPGTRVLSFRLVSSDGLSKPLRRSGPSPQTLTVNVDDPGQFGEWTLTINALATKGGGEGRLEIRLPTTAIPEVVAPVPVVDPAPTRDDARRLSAEALPEEWSPFARSAIGFTSMLESEPRPDACRWQRSFGEWLDGRLTDLAQDGSGPAVGTRRSLARIVDAINSVEQVRGSSGPILGTPPPDDPDFQQEWFQIRATRLLEIQAGLDKVSVELRRGHAPELAGESWPDRLVACVTACERHFEERARFGADGAVNRDMAEAQWDRMLAASRVIEAFATLPERP